MQSGAALLVAGAQNKLKLIINANAATEAVFLTIGVFAFIAK